MLAKASVSEKGNIITYSNDGVSVKINKKTGLFTELEKKDLFVLKISSYKNFNKISKIPDELIFTAQKTKFKCVIKLKNSAFPANKDFENFRGQDDTQSAGKN